MKPVYNCIDIHSAIVELMWRDFEQVRFPYFSREQLVKRDYCIWFTDTKRHFLQRFEIAWIVGQIILLQFIVESQHPIIMKQPISLGTFVPATLLVSLILLFVSPLVFAGKIETKDGSVINGKILSIEGGVIKVETSYAGELSIKKSEVAVFSSDETINVSTDGGNTFKGTVSGEGDAIKIAAQGGTFETSVGNVTAAWQPGEDSPKEKALKAEIAANERKWKFDVSADISGKSGNSDRSAVGVGATAVLEGKQDRLMFYGSIDNAEENDNTTADEIKGGIDYSSFFLDSLS